LTGLDRRFVERTDVQYTCPCPVPVAETGDTGGESYSSASPSSSADEAESTEDCEEYVPSANVGSMADGEITDNETPAKRFLPLEYSIAHPIEERLYDPPPPSFVPDGELKKRTEPTGAVTDNPGGAPTTVTSTTTITGTCTGTDAAQTGVGGASSEVSITGGETSTSGGGIVVAAPPTTNAYGSLTTMWAGGADDPNSTPAAAATNGSNGLSGAVSGVIDGSSL
jgi:hypothetical protein